jgi:predicted ATP-grasp superfamily ATP-dependent carboligase
VIGLADDPSHFCCRTNTCKHVIHTDTSNVQLIDTLIALGRDLEQKAVIIPCSDESIRIISLNRDVLGKWFSFVMPEHDIIELFTDKMKFYKFCQSSGLPIPPTFFPTAHSDLKEITEKIPPPYIVKPAVRTDSWFKYFPNKVYKIRESRELYDLFDKFLTVAGEIVVQEWVGGSDKNLYSCIVYYDAESRPLINFTSRKLRQWHIEDGEGSLAEECKNDIVLRLANDLFGRVTFKGIGSLELKIDDRNGEYYIIEPNIARPVSRIGLVESAGVEILHTLYLDALSMPLTTRTEQRFRGAKWISLHMDFLAARAYHARGELTLQDWLNSIRGVNTFAVLSMRDPLPFVFEIFPIFKASLHNLLHGTGKFLKSIGLRINKNPDKT